MLIVFIGFEGGPPPPNFRNGLPHASSGVPQPPACGYRRADGRLPPRWARLPLFPLCPTELATRTRRANMAWHKRRQVFLISPPTCRSRTELRRLNVSCPVTGVIYHAALGGGGVSLFSSRARLGCSCPSPQNKTSQRKKQRKTGAVCDGPALVWLGCPSGKRKGYFSRVHRDLQTRSSNSCGFALRDRVSECVCGENAPW